MVAIDVTPVFVIVGVPVEADTLIPTPCVTVCTPVLVNVGVPVAEDTLTPVPCVTVCTPVFNMVEVPADVVTEMPVLCATFRVVAVFAIVVDAPELLTDIFSPAII